jgi:putative chitinase
MDATTLARCTGARLDRAQTALAGIVAAMATYEINTPARIGMFLANVGHETLGFKFTTEIWGPTEAQHGYEGRADLGNVKPGDGKLYRGRGDFQTTGRANYAKLRDRLRAKGLACPDFEADPEKVADPEWAPLAAADYVEMRRLNALADRGAFIDYCAGVNGRSRKTGLPNGIEERTKLWTACQEVLS